MSKLPTAILHNGKLDRWHPIVFRPAPLPNGADREMGALRYRSLGHHTEGFGSLEDAQAHIASEPEYRSPEVVYEWDGESSPHMTHWFAEEGDRNGL